MANKIDFKKTDKAVYAPSTKTPEVRNIPTMSYLIIDGNGNPNSEPFQLAIKALYSLSYKIKMSLKKSNTIVGYYDYVVPPLEGIWDIMENVEYNANNKDNLKWKIMIRQPEFISSEIVNKYLEELKTKDDNSFLAKIKLSEIEDGLCCQMMHIGSFDNEPETFNIMEKWCAESRYKRINKTHREIYLSNFQKTAPENLKTILRFKIEKV